MAQTGIESTLKYLVKIGLIKPLHDDKQNKDVSKKKKKRKYADQAFKRRARLRESFSKNNRVTDALTKVVHEYPYDPMRLREIQSDLLQNLSTINKGIQRASNRFEILRRGETDNIGTFAATESSDNFQTAGQRFPSYPSRFIPPVVEQQQKQPPLFSAAQLEPQPIQKEISVDIPTESSIRMTSPGFLLTPSMPMSKPRESVRIVRGREPRVTQGMTFLPRSRPIQQQQEEEWGMSPESLGIDVIPPQKMTLNERKDEIRKQIFDAGGDLSGLRSNASIDVLIRRLDETRA